ncbi:MAG: hypothetical protein KC636_12075 [Myxococcales bacterium]|nr:hypothetical protein [Myxococcales bacterium]
MDTRQQKSRMWTWLILLFLLGLGVVIANVVISNPQLAEEGVDAVMGMPAWAFPGIVAFIGLFVFWLGLKVEANWPEALGAALVAGSITAGEVMIGWNDFAFGGIAAIPYVLPFLVFVIMLMFALARSK